MTHVIGRLIAKNRDQLRNPTLSNRVLATFYRRVYDLRHLQADCQEPGSAPAPYARQSSTDYLYLFKTAQFRLFQLS